MDYYISSNVRYTSEDGKFFKNGIELTNENGDALEEVMFKAFIKKETATFIHRAFNNIIVLVGAGASVLSTSGGIDRRFGKTVFMLADLINNTLKQDINLFTLQELAELCKYQTIFLRLYFLLMRYIVIQNHSIRKMNFIMD